MLTTVFIHFQSGKFGPSNLQWRGKERRFFSLFRATEVANPTDGLASTCRVFPKLCGTHPQTQIQKTGAPRGPPVPEKGGFHRLRLLPPPAVTPSMTHQNRPPPPQARPALYRSAFPRRHFLPRQAAGLTHCSYCLSVSSHENRSTEGGVSVGFIY